MGANAVFLLSCPDQPGVVAGVSSLIALHHGNIVDSEQHVDAVEGAFFQRIEFELDSFDLARRDIRGAMQPLVDRFSLRLDIRYTDVRPRTVLLASKQPHCLYDLLTRWRTGELPTDLVGVVSNHDDHRDFCTHMGVPYVHLPVSPATKATQERHLLEVLSAFRADTVVLARYMQILSPTVVEAYPERIINIHHSFLPAFVGANPYRQAHDRGVKIIGATAHYVTADLDEGPIIEQEVSRASHRDDVSTLAQKGRDLETVVLARAVRAHLQHRILVYGRKTVVFG